MEIRIDTSVINIMADISLKMVSEMECAVRASGSVTAHNDWNCKEREKINELIEKVNKDNRIVCEELIAFSKQLHSAAVKFDEVDGMIKSKFSAFDSSIGALSSIECGRTVTHPNGRFERLLTDLQHSRTVSGSRLSVHSFQELTEPIRVSDASELMAVTGGRDVGKHIDEEALLNELMG